MVFLWGKVVLIPYKTIHWENNFKFCIVTCIPAVEKTPNKGGGMGYGAGRWSGASTQGATHDGPHSHPGEGSVWAGPTVSEKPLQHCPAVLHLCKDQVTFELQAERKLQRNVW